jgi:hypothetical protein
VSIRAGRELTHRLVPSAAALRPSRVVANFQVTNGRRCSRANVQARFTARASRSSRPMSTTTPAARSAWAPPAATGLGSGWANTTRATPASISACAHGPVRPVWLHGSSVTTAVAPLAASADPSASTAASAAASACGVPAPRWNPSAISEPSGASSTQPTRGLGPSGTPGEAASSRARLIARSMAAPSMAAPSTAAAVGVMRPFSPRPTGSGRAQGSRAQSRQHHSLDNTTARDDPACFFPSGLSPSVQDFHLVNRSLAANGSRTVTAGSEFHRSQSTRVVHS